MDNAPVTLSVVWDSYTELRAKLTTEQIMSKTLALDSEGVADTRLLSTVWGNRYPEETEAAKECIN